MPNADVTKGICAAVDQYSEGQLCPQDLLIQNMSRVILNCTCSYCTVIRTLSIEEDNESTSTAGISTVQVQVVLVHTVATTKGREARNMKSSVTTRTVQTCTRTGTLSPLLNPTMHSGVTPTSRVITVLQRRRYQYQKSRKISLLPLLERRSVVKSVYNSLRFVTSNHDNACGSTIKNPMLSINQQYYVTQDPTQ